MDSVDVTVITFLTDFGLAGRLRRHVPRRDRRIAPDARVIDMTHGIAPQAVLTGRARAPDTTPFMPVGVHLAVVDPDVGGNRRAVAVGRATAARSSGPTTAC